MSLPVLGLLGLAVAGADCVAAGDMNPEELGYDPVQCHRDYGAYLASGELDAPELPYDCALYFGRLLEGPCHDLIIATCGEFDQCADEPDCVLSRLAAEPHESETECHDTFTQNAFVPCTAVAVNPCLDLVRHVCGGSIEEDKPCGDHPACVQALYLFESGGAVGCEQALREATLYPRCE